MKKHFKIFIVIGLVLMIILGGLASPLTLFVEIFGSAKGLFEGLFDGIKEFTGIEYLVGRISNDEQDVYNDIEASYQEAIPDGVLGAAKDMAEMAADYDLEFASEITSAFNADSELIDTMTYSEYVSIGYGEGALSHSSCGEGHEKEWVVRTPVALFYVSVEPETSELASEQYLAYAHSVDSTLADYFVTSKEATTDDMAVDNSEYLSEGCEAVGSLDDDRIHKCLQLSYEEITWDDIPKRINFKKTANLENAKAKAGTGYILKRMDGTVTLDHEATESEVFNAIGGDVAMSYNKGLIKEETIEMDCSKKNTSAVNYGAGWIHSYNVCDLLYIYS